MNLEPRRLRACRLGANPAIKLSDSQKSRSCLIGNVAGDSSQRKSYPSRVEAFTDGVAWSADNVRLHWRDYPGDPARPALLCLPGLTRNARDFHALALRHAGSRRVLCVSFRGRGESGHARDPLTYVPLTYVQDMEQVIAAAGLERFVVLGTSLGGLVAMLMAAAEKPRMAGVVLNDVGPELLESGLARIRAQVGRGNGWPTWLHAARDIAERQAGVYPRWRTQDWLAHAKRLCRLSQAGRIVWDYDTRIAEPFRLPGADAPVDLWHAFEALRGVPVLSIRGALSDVFAGETHDTMKERLPDLTTVVVPDVGHAPTLEEPEAVAALDAFLAKTG